MKGRLLASNLLSLFPSTDRTKTTFWFGSCFPSFPFRVLSEEKRDGAAAYPKDRSPLSCVALSSASEEGDVESRLVLFGSFFAWLFVYRDGARLSFPLLLRQESGIHV